MVFYSVIQNPWLLYHLLRAAWGCPFYPPPAAESKEKTFLGHVEVAFVIPAHISLNSNVRSYLTAWELGDGVRLCAKENN